MSFGGLQWARTPKSSLVLQGKYVCVKPLLSVARTVDVVLFFHTLFSCVVSPVRERLKIGFRHEHAPLNCLKLSSKMLQGRVCHHDRGLLHKERIWIDAGFGFCTTSRILHSRCLVGSAILQRFPGIRPRASSHHRTIALYRHLCSSP